ncbi:hypothetical protein BDF19DRAFT_415480 [Syncephalis fuscata]|nr:hypothetical protein BDF19DRAFT_415480 [Syncephalis fuscata]
MDSMGYSQSILPRQWSRLEHSTASTISKHFFNIMSTSIRQRLSPSAILLIACFLVITVVEAKEQTQQQHTDTKDPSHEQPVVHPMVAYSASIVVGWVSQALYYLLRPFYLAGYWVVYITILLPGQLLYSAYVAVAPIIGFLLVAAGVGVCMGGGAAWSVQTAAEMGWGDVAGIFSSNAAITEQDANDKENDEDDDRMSNFSLFYDHANTARIDGAKYSKQGVLHRRDTLMTELSNFSDWESEDNDEDDEDDEPPSDKEDPTRLFDAILERNRKQQEEMALGKVPADYALWNQNSTHANTGNHKHSAYHEYNTNSTMSNYKTRPQTDTGDLDDKDSLLYERDHSDAFEEAHAANGRATTSNAYGKENESRKTV